MTVKADIDSKSPVLVEPNIVDETDSEAVEDPGTKSEVEEPFIETLVDLPAEHTIELVSVIFDSYESLLEIV